MRGERTQRPQRPPHTPNLVTLRLSLDEATISGLIHEGSAVAFRHAQETLERFAADHPGRHWETINLTLHLVESGIKHAPRSSAPSHFLNLLARYYSAALTIAAREHLLEPADGRLLCILTASEPVDAVFHERLCDLYASATTTSPDPTARHRPAVYPQKAEGESGRGRTPEPPQSPVRSDAREGARLRLAGALRLSELKSSGRAPLPHERLHPRLPAAYQPNTDDPAPHQTP